MPRKIGGRINQRWSQERVALTEFVLDVQCRRKFGCFTISSNSRCHLSSYILSVFALFSDSRLSISILQNVWKYEWNVPQSQPCSQSFSDTLPFSGIYSILLTSFSVFCNCFPNLVNARLTKGFEPIRNKEIFCMDDKYHKEFWTNTLEVSLGWSQSLSIFGHFCDILSSISLYGTNFFKFHLFPSNKKIKQVKQSTNDWCNDNKNHDTTFGFKMLLIAGEGTKNKDDYRALINAYCNFSHNCSNWTINYFVTSIIIINIKSKQ